MNLYTVLNALLLVYFTKAITSQETNNGVCNTHLEGDDVQCALQNIQSKLEAYALNMRDLRETILFQSIRDCSDLYNRGQRTSGVYSIYTGYFRRAESISVYCDMETDGGGWTVFQRRVDGSEDFNRYWSDYRDGFGDVAREHWLGNTLLYMLTSTETNRNYTLRIDLSDWEGEERYAVYTGFRIGSEFDNFKLHLDGYVSADSNVDDSLSYHNGMEFSTRDRDNDMDTRTGQSCAAKYGGEGGFWFNSCKQVGANNPYASSSDGYQVHPVNRIRWDAWHGIEYSLKTFQMMMRPTV